MRMYTVCPECRTWFAVTEDHLGAAGGLVKCGQCLASFDASLHLWSAPDETSRRVLWAGVLLDADEEEEEARDAGAVDSLADPPPPPHGTPPGPNGGADGSFEPLAAGFDLEAGSGPKSGAGPALGDVRGLRDPLETMDTAMPAVHMAGYGEGRDSSRRQYQNAAILAKLAKAHNPRPRRRWSAALAVLLSLGFVCQYTWFRAGDVIALAPALAPYVEGFCELTGCRTDVRAQWQTLQVVARTVRPHAEYQGVVTVHATLENRTDVLRPLPSVLFVLYGKDGRPIASRAFRPDEYLPEGAAPPAGIDPGGRLNIAFDFVAPREAAVSFDLRPV